MNTKQRKMFSMSASVIILLSMLTACSQSTGDTENKNTLPPSTMADAQQSQVEEIKVKDFELKNKEITFLASWARNPANGKNKDVALELFQNKFGGKVNDIVVTDAERYQKLSTMVSTDQSPDFFSAGDMDAFPKGAISKMFQPLDNYIDFNDEWFKDRKSINDPFSINGKHYASIISPEIDVLMIYNKAVIKENALTDTADLLKEGKWDWDTCKKMMTDFCGKGEERYAIDGWWVSKGFTNSSGVPFIGMTDGKIVNNIRDSKIEKAQEFLYNLNKENLAYPLKDKEWKTRADYVGEGKTLFFAVGYWALTEVNTEYGLVQYGDIKDVGFVPVPKCPTADNLYIPARVTGYMLCSGAPNPEGFAALMYCEAAANGSEEAEKITKEQYFNEYGWTDSMWEMRNTMFKMVKEHPVFDFLNGISDTVFDNIDNPSKDAYHNGNSWVQTRETIYSVIQSEIDQANAALAG